MGELSSQSLPQLPGTVLDPRATHITWSAVRATAARRGAIASDADLAEARAAMTELLERTWEPGRTAALVRIQTERSDDGRPTLQLCLALGLVGGEDDAEEADALAEVALATLARYPEPFILARDDAGALLGQPVPAHLAAIRRRLLEVEIEDGTVVRGVSRFERMLDAWLDFATLIAEWPSPLVYQASFMSTVLPPSEAVRLEHSAAQAADVAAFAADTGNPVLARRAARLRETLVDLAEACNGPLWLGEVTVGSDGPLPAAVVRAVAGSVTNETAISGRVRTGGACIERIANDDALSRIAWRLGLPGVALAQPQLRDYFPLEDADCCWRWPVPAGRALEGLPTSAACRRGAPAGLPTSGLHIGRDVYHRDVFLGPDGLTTHLWAPGATGSGKSTLMRRCIRYDLELGRPFIALDPHGDLTRGIRSDAAELGREIAVFDADEPDTLRLDLLGGLDRSVAGDADLYAHAVSRLSEAFASYRPSAEYGPRYRDLARAVLGAAISIADRQSVGVRDLGRILTDDEFLRRVAARSRDKHATNVLQLHIREQDRAGVGLWAASKFDDIALSPGADRIFAPFFDGVSIGRAIEAGVPIVMNLGSASLSRVASALLGHVALACTVDYALTRSAGRRQPFALYVDEAQRFPARNLVDALAETRKYGCFVFVAHQELSQLEPQLRDALVVNAATRVLFRTGLVDAHVLGPATSLGASELTSLPNLTAFVQTAGSSPFTLRLEPPPPVRDVPPYVPPASLAPVPAMTVERGEESVPEDVAEDDSMPSYRSMLARFALPPGLVEVGLDEEDE